MWIPTAGDRLHIGLHSNEPPSALHWVGNERLSDRRGRHRWLGLVAACGGPRRRDRCDHGAKLIVATAHPLAPEEHGGWSVPPGSTHGEDYPDGWRRPRLRDPAGRQGAGAQGAKNVEEKPIVGAP